MRLHLSKKYRAKSLADYAGDFAYLRRLRSFVASPCSWCFLFHGKPGTGKSAAAYALTRDLGTDPISVDFIELQADSLRADEIRRSLQPILRIAPWGAGYRVIVIEEGEGFSPESLRLLNVLLDPCNLPTRTVFVVTTNHPEFFEARESLWERRIEPLEFPSDPAVVADSCDEVLGRVWNLETGQAAESCPVKAMDCVNVHGTLSVGLCLSRLDPVVCRFLGGEAFDLKADSRYSESHPARRHPLIWDAENKPAGQEPSSPTTETPKPESNAMKDRATMLEQIKALLSKTTDNGCTQAEAEQAMALAQKLMDKYCISAGDVAAAEGAAAGHGESMNFEVAWDAPWMDQQIPWLATVVNQAFNVRCVIQRGQPLRDQSKYKLGVQLKVFGHTANRAAAVWAVNYLHRVYRELWTAYRKEHGGKLSTKDQESFFMGVTRGIKGKLTISRRRDLTKQESNAIALYSQNVDKEIEKWGWRFVPGKPRPVKNGDAFSAGILAGEKVSLNRPVSSSGGTRVSISK